MKHCFTILLFSFFRIVSFTQQPVMEPIGELNSNQLEESAETEESETENDYDLQQLNYFIKHPIDINGNELDQLSLIDPLLINNLSVYRKLLGDIIDLHELQAVPGFTIDLIKSILPYITINKDEWSLTQLHERLTRGERSMLIRQSIVPEVASGFKSSSDERFTGSRAAFFLRYKYQFRNLLQYGFVADKDAGEKMLHHGMPDFASFHIFARRIGIIKSIALGDFTINLGQGLIHWQSQAFRKSSSVLNIKRQSEVLRPYQSSGEYNFHRGIAATFAKRFTELSVFISKKNLTANIDDSVITSVNVSGFHRTAAELDDKNHATLFTTGGALKENFRQGHIGFNWVYYRYSLPLMRRDEPYNLYSIKGKEWGNVSVDYSHTFANYHFFGEFAADRRRSCAFINGVIASLSGTVDMTALVRYFNRSYQSVFGNAFSENTMPGNESGFYCGFSIKPHTKWRVDLYSDLFTFPWLKYRLDAPSTGAAYLIQLTWKPDKQTEVYSRFRYRMKPLNIENEDDLNIPGTQNLQNWRTHVNRQVSRTILIRSRVEVCFFSHQYLTQPSSGYLFYVDITCKPVRSWLSGNLRLQAFEADNYDTRIYAYENDLLFVSSTPSFYNNGVRVYTNLRGKFKVKILSNSILAVNLKLATTAYNNISYIGSGPSKIAGNRISAVKLQLFLLGF